MGGGGGGGDSHIKRGGILVVSLRGVHFGYWSHLGPIYTVRLTTGTPKARNPESGIRNRSTIQRVKTILNIHKS